MKLKPGWSPPTFSLSLSSLIEMPVDNNVARYVYEVWKSPEMVTRDRTFCVLLETSISATANVSPSQLICQYFWIVRSATTILIRKEMST